MRTHTRRLPISILVFLLLYGLTALSACGATPAAQAPTAAPAGDPAKGELVFNTSDCKACHVTTDQKLVGPGLKGVMEGKGQYGDKLPNGKPISDKNATEWIKVGGVGKIGQMPGHPDLTQEQLLDLVAYLKTLK
jgi:cytochrome c551/c552